MTRTTHYHRRDFLKSAGIGLAALQIPPAFVAAESDNEPFVLRSQPLPQPQVVLPTDALPAPQGPKNELPPSRPPISNTRMPMTSSPNSLKATPSSGGRIFRTVKW